MKRTIMSAALGVGLACAVFWVVDAIDAFRRAATVAELQAQASDEWFDLLPMEIVDGSNRDGVVIEPVAVWSVSPKRLLEVRAAVVTRDLATGEPICTGGTNTVITDPAPLRTYRRELSRFAGVDSCDWPVGEYRSRFTWTLIDPVTRVTKTLFQEPPPFSVRP